MTLSVEKFLPRVLPKRLARGRHFGWLSAATRKRFERGRARLDWHLPLRETVSGAGVPLLSRSLHFRDTDPRMSAGTPENNPITKKALSTPSKRVSSGRFSFRDGCVAAAGN
jgi:hypothetical protein